MFAFMPYFGRISSIFHLNPPTVTKSEGDSASLQRDGVWIRRPLHVGGQISGFLSASCLAASLGMAYGSVYGPSKIIPPAPIREIRAVWVATVANIDWPSTNGLSTAQQKTELRAILDRAAELKLNTVIFQVRSACDALYPSNYEPWSEYLTGTMGIAPKPFYDPLGFAVEEAHKRGLELHAWFNPFRARQARAKSMTAATHISRKRPELVKQYGQSLWLDPGERAVQDYSLNVVLDVVKRYDIDGVHFDDYFYPYKEKDASGSDLDFPDETSWQRYGAGSKLNRDDWRRENVNVFIHRTYESIKAIKPWVKFGISPFGIWRPGNPPQIQGYDSFAKLYADSRQWLAKGWLDYFAPQLYWAIKPPEQSFPVLLKWWVDQNAKGRHLAPGLDCTKADGRWPAEEIVNQIRLTRKQTGTSGHIHWNMGSLMRNDALVQALKRGLYAEPALFPPLPWLNHESPPTEPRLRVSTGSEGTRANWEAGGKEDVWLWVVQLRRRTEWTARLIPGRTRQLSLSGPVAQVIALTAVDRYGNESRPAVLEQQHTK